MAPARRQAANRRRLVTAGFSLAGHALILWALLNAHTDPPRPIEPEPISVALVEAPPAVAVAAPSAAAPPSPVEPPPPPRNLARPARVRPEIEPLPAGEGRAADQGVELSEAQLAGAATAGSGAPGRPCDMARRLQAALRRDPLIQSAVADASRARAAGSAGKALFVWNGDWIRSYGQDGNGLAAVREAIMWEVAFAPEACRAEPVHGLVLISLNDGPGSARLVVGSGDWRWSDLLHPRPAG